MSNIEYVSIENHRYLNNWWVYDREDNTADDDDDDNEERIDDDNDAVDGYAGYDEDDDNDAIDDNDGYAGYDEDDDDDDNDGYDGYDEDDDEINDNDYNELCTVPQTTGYSNPFSQFNLTAPYFFYFCSHRRFFLRLAYNYLKLQAKYWNSFIETCLDLFKSFLMTNPANVIQNLHAFHMGM